MRGLSISVLVLFASAVSFSAAAQEYASAPNRPAQRPPAWVDGQGQEITVKGEQVCLKRRERTGRQLLSCAMGFRSDDEKFYALHDTDPQYRNVSLPGARKQISGTLWPSLSDDYVDIGTIEVRKAVVIEDPKVLVGQYACLPRSTRQSAKPNHCTMGIKTRSGFYWAFYTLSPGAREQLSTLKAGDSIAVEGAVGTYVDEEGWSNLWRNHPEIEGALRVTDVKRNAS